MRDFFFVHVIIYIGLFCLIFIADYYTQDYKQKSVISTMTETAQVASVQSIDKSIRVQKGEVEFSQSEFENNFQTLFEKNSNVSLSDPTFHYSFLSDGNGGVKAVRVQIIDKSNAKYQVTFVSNIAS